MTSETTQEAVLVRSPAHEFQPLVADPLETVGRRARLESASAQDPRAVLRDACGHGLDLLGAFHAARPGHHHHLFAPDGDAPAHLHDGSLRAEMPAGQLIRRRNPQNFLDSVQQLDVAGVEIHFGAHRPQHRVARSGRTVDIEIPYPSIY